MKFHKAESYQYIIYSVIKTKIIKKLQFNNRILLASC